MHIVLSIATVGGAFAALLGAILILLNAQFLGRRFSVMDHPDNVRKKHVRVTPLIGGLAIMIPLVIWTAATSFQSDALDNRLLLLAVLLCGANATLIGFADDQSSTSPFSRLLSLILLTVMALIIDPQLVPAQFHWGSFQPTMLAPWFAFCFMAVAMTGLVNAVNMADGQDGVVAGMFVIWSFCMMLVGGGASVSVTAVLFATSLAVLLFNLGGRVFLGDAGTYGVTFVFGILAIRLHNGWGVSVETIVVWFFIPVVDCLRMMVSRALQGQSPVEGDRDHFHHRLEDKFGKDGGLAVYLGIVATSSVIASLAPHLALVCLVILASVYFSFAWLTVEPLEKELEQAGNVVPLESKDAKSSRR